jgi:hypothetical protein
MAKSLIHLSVPTAVLESVQSALSDQFGTDNHGVNEHDGQHGLSYVWVQKKGNKFSAEEQSAINPYLSSVEYPYED